MSEVLTTTMLPNIIGGERVESSSTRTLPVLEPNTGVLIGDVPLSSAAELDEAVAVATKAQLEWAKVPMKDRVQVLYNMKTLVEAEKDHLAEIVTRENGKTHAESMGSVMRAVECLEFGVSLPQIATGDIMEVSRGVECRTVRRPVGVTAVITPFNFPFMVPLWMIPMALGMGNSVILKPSEQTPLSALEIGRLLKESGLPDGVFSVVNGDREIVEAMCDHPGISAIGFVGSTRVAKIVYGRGSANGKRVRAMGGAKNHLTVVPDADPEMTATNVVASVTGCAGQRCMAASVLLAVGDVDHILTLIKQKMEALVIGRDMGAIISEAAYERITGYLERTEAGGAVLELDGREASLEEAHPGGHYLGASIIDHASPEHEASCEEIFGPTLTIIRCDTLEDALAIENANPYGNAAAIYTSNGGTAQYFSERASAGMVGVNIGVPVPREPFAFGGWNDSAFGGGDVTGPTAIDFWSKAKKITTKWSDQHRSNWMS